MKALQSDRLARLAYEGVGASTTFCNCIFMCNKKVNPSFKTEAFRFKSLVWL